MIGAKSVLFVHEKYLIQIHWLNCTVTTKPYLKFFIIFFQKEKFTSAADEAGNVQQAMQGMCC